METIDQVKEFIMAHPYLVAMYAVYLVTVILIFFIARKAMKLKHRNNDLKLDNEFVSANYHTACGNYNKLVDKYNDLDKKLSQKEGENDKLKKDYDSLLNIHNGEKKYLQEQLIASKHETKLIAMDYVFRLLKNNSDGYTTKDVREMIEMISGFLKK